MHNERFDQAVSKILERDSAFPRQAYELMPAALNYTLRRLQAGQPGAEVHGHVNGRQLAEGFRDFMLEEYGPFAADILAKYNIRSTADIGRLVYNLISVGMFGKTENDREADFRNLYDFRDAFELPFQPVNPLGKPPPGMQM